MPTWATTADNPIELTPKVEVINTNIVTAVLEKVSIFSIIIKKLIKNYLGSSLKDLTQYT